MHKNDGVPVLAVRCVGDIAPVRLVQGISGGTDGGEFARQLLKSVPHSCLAVANLEAPVVSQVTPREDKRYTFCTYVSAFDLFGPRSVLSQANNHIMDYGEKGLVETIAALNAKGIAHAGAGRNPGEARRPALIASVHMDIEFLPVPSIQPIERAEDSARASASVVHFHHTHTIRRIQKIGAYAVLFGAGNFLFPYLLAIRAGYLWLAIFNYGDMIRRRGLIHAARQFVCVLRAIFTGRS
jgi:poly-gamma-glutamate synthesis protein (capsule biosynthesis protein)